MATRRVKVEMDIDMSAVMASMERLKAVTAATASLYRRWPVLPLDRAEPGVPGPQRWPGDDN